MDRPVSGNINNEMVPEPQFGDIPARKPGWALSLFDFQAHAIDRLAEHPFGVFIALCGHRMFDGILYDDPPGGTCVGCGTSVVTRRRAGKPANWARSSDDVPCHALEPTQIRQVAEREFVEALCGDTLPSGGLIVEDAPSSPLCRGCVLGATS